MKLLLSKWSKNTLILADDLEVQAFQFVPNGELVEADVTVNRSLNFHRKFRGFLNLCYNTIHEEVEHKYPTFEVFYDAIRLATGKYHIKVLANKDKRLIFDSTSFDEMDEIDYRYFVFQVIRLIEKNYFNLGDHRVLLQLLKRYNYF